MKHEASVDGGYVGSKSMKFVSVMFENSENVDSGNRFMKGLGVEDILWVLRLLALPSHFLPGAGEDKNLECAGLVSEA